MNAILNYKDEKFYDYGFGFTIDVSLDSNCGVFRRYHVGNNPVNHTDPTGLHMDCLRGGCRWHLSCIDNHEHPNRDATEGRCFYDPPIEIPPWVCRMGINAGCNLLCKRLGGNPTACRAACKAAAELVCPNKCEDK